MEFSGSQTANVRPKMEKTRCVQSVRRTDDLPSVHGYVEYGHQDAMCLEQLPAAAGVIDAKKGSCSSVVELQEHSCF